MADDARFSWDDLMKYRKAKPFRPFFMEMRGGMLAEVLEPLWFGGAGDRLVVFDPSKPRRQELKRSDVENIRLMNVEELAERLPLITRRGA